jgi:hypothetical protein
MSQLPRLAAFVFLLLMALAVGRSRGARKRQAVLALAAYLVGIHLALAITERDWWPFSNHRLLHARALTNLPFWEVEVYGVDATGKEWRIDERAWAPLSDTILQQWLARPFASLSPPEKENVMRFLLMRVEADRLRAAAGSQRGFERYLGPLAAPFWWMRAAHRSSPVPYRALRIYSESWQPRERLADPRRVQRLLLAELR